MENSTRESSGNATEKNINSNPTILVIQLICYTAIIFVGTFGNIFIFSSIMYKKKRKISDYFIVNLTIADLLCCVVSIPFDIMERTVGYWPLGLFMCKIVYPLQTVLMAVSVVTLLFMAFERHRAIIEPLKPKIEGKYVLMTIIVLWITAIILVSPYMLVLEMDRQKCTENWPAPVFVKAFTASVFVLLYIVPLSIITAAYIRVGVRLRRGTSSFRKTFASCIAGRRVVQARVRRNIHVVKIFVCAVIAFAVCLLPFHIMWLWYDFGDGKYYNHYYDLLTFANILAYSNSAINPFIFGSLSKKFRSCSFRQSKNSAAFRNRMLQDGRKNLKRYRNFQPSNASNSNLKLIVRIRNGFTDRNGSRDNSLVGRRRCDRQTGDNCPIIMMITSL